MVKIKEEVKNWKRVLNIARKPDKEEFTATSKVCAIGLLLIGFIGFIIFLIAVFAGF
jgi:protein transport protein SEC61 subunit gamma-like protein